MVKENNEEKLKVSKIKFFNKVMKIHDPENSYDEKLADIILCNFHEFDIYYEIYKILKQNYEVKLVKLIFTDDENDKSIKKYTFKISDSSISKEVYDFLKNTHQNISTEYSRADVSYSKNKNGTIFVTINNIELLTKLKNYNELNKQHNDRK